MDKFTKWFEWTKRNKDLTQNGMLLICVLIEKWEFHKHQPFHYSIKWLGEQIKVKKDDTVLKALNNLVELNLITITKKYENSNKGKNYYSINEETVNKLSGIAGTSTPTEVNKDRGVDTIDGYNTKLIELFNKYKDKLLVKDDFERGKVREYIRNKLSTPEAVKLFGSQGKFNENYNKQYKLWYQEQKDLKSQTP